VTRRLTLAAIGLLGACWAGPAAPQAFGPRWPWGPPADPRERMGPPPVVVPPGGPVGERRRYYRPTYGKWWPGQVLPPDAPTVLITDYGRYHLRLPPRGYAWLLCDGDLILAAIGSREIFEVIPYGSY